MYASVTKRITEVKQPRGGYIKPKEFTEIKVDDGKVLFEKENINPTNVGMAVDYLTRHMMGGAPLEAFGIPAMGAANAEKCGKSTVKEFESILEKVNGLTDESIIAACRLTSYDVWFRNKEAALASNWTNQVIPDKNTISNIRIMVERAIDFFDKYGPIVESGFTFEPDGYTATVFTGDGDYLTIDTIWDFKVSKKPLTNKQTLQLAMYYIMGKHSGKDIYLTTKNIGIFNPRLNIIYSLDMSTISDEIIKTIERDVICYE